MNYDIRLNNIPFSHKFDGLKVHDLFTNVFILSLLRRASFMPSFIPLIMFSLIALILVSSCSSCAEDSVVSSCFKYLFGVLSRILIFHILRYDVFPSSNCILQARTISDFRNCFCFVIPFFLLCILFLYRSSMIQCLYMS